MSAGKYDIKIDQGSDYATQIVVKDNGVAQDLTIYTARAQMRSRKSSSTIAATFTCSIPNPTDGTILMELPHATSSALTPGLYYYDLEIYTAGEASVTRLLEGKVTLTPEVTR